MAAMANGLWNGHATPSETASSIASIPDGVSTPLAPVPRHTASGQPGQGGGHGRMDHQHVWETGSCHICGQVKQQTEESSQQTEPANRTAMCQHIICTIQARPADCHQHKRPRQWNWRIRTTKLAESAPDTIAQSVQVASTSPTPVRATGSEQQSHCRSCCWSKAKQLPVQYWQTVGRCQLIMPVCSC